MNITMTFHNIKSMFRQCWGIYLLGILIILGIKFFYSKADSDDLIWILAPTAWWVRILSGIDFEYAPHIGFLNHSFRFIIAPSCSGVQFMMITFATLIYSFVHRMRTKRGRFCWMALSLWLSYLLTVFVNGIRIVLSIYLPISLRKAELYSGWISPERLHTLIGIIVYFTFLFTIYHIAGYISWKAAGRSASSPEHAHLPCPDSSIMHIIGSCMPPVFWYFTIVLGIPFFNRAYQNNFENFIEYALLMTGVCLTILFLFCLMTIIRNYFAKQKQNC